MKILFAFGAALALTIGTAAAQGGNGAPPGATPTNKSGASNVNSKKIVVRSGGQGHNSTPEPKGKILVAPTTPSGNSGKRTNSQSNGH